ncbi:MAG: hypothetical protein ABFC85_03770, partial [Rectinema sp.]
LAFSVLFFGIPLVRSWRLKRENEMLKRENMRKVLYSAVIANPRGFDHRTVSLPSEEVRPSAPEAVQEEVRHLAAWSSGEISAEGIWAFKDLEFIQREAEQVRASIRETDYAPQKTVFDTDEKV